MSRRHSSSRRRNYGRRQHEIRERRPSSTGRTDWIDPLVTDDGRDDFDEPRNAPGATDGYGASRP